MKALHREIMLSSVYALSAEHSDKNFAADPENRLLWRANRRRLDAEALRDSLLAAGGTLDRTIGGPAARLDRRQPAADGLWVRQPQEAGWHAGAVRFSQSEQHERAAHRHQRPLQRLFFMNSGSGVEQAEALAERLKGERCRAIREAYRHPVRPRARPAGDRAGLEFLRNGKEPWPQYAQVLLSSNEFCFVN